MGKCVKNPGLLLVALILLIFGCAFFFGFYFGMIEEDKRKNQEIDDWIARTLPETCEVAAIHETIEETCRIHTLDVTEVACSYKSNCQCLSSYPFTTCAQRESVPGASGVCRDSYCCYYWVDEICGVDCGYQEYDEYEGTWDYVCWDCDNYCDIDSYETCNVQWGSCWDIEWTFSLLENGTVSTDKEYPTSDDDRCPYGNTVCKTDYETYFAVNATPECWYTPDQTDNQNTQRGNVVFDAPSEWVYFAYFVRVNDPSKMYPPHKGIGQTSSFDAVYDTIYVGENITCWYDPQEDEVFLVQPNDDGKVNADRGWAGAVWGLLAWAIMLVLIWFAFDWFSCCEDSSNYNSRMTSSGQDKPYNPYQTQSDTVELPVAVAVAVPAN